MSADDGPDLEALVTAKQTVAGAPLADLVSVPPGRAAVVRDPESRAYAVVTDRGKLFPVESIESLQALGYNDDDAVTMPRAVIGRIPAGPALTRDGAATPVD